MSRDGVVFEKCQSCGESDVILAPDDMCPDCIVQKKVGGIRIGSMDILDRNNPRIDVDNLSDIGSGVLYRLYAVPETKG